MTPQQVQRETGFLTSSRALAARRYQYASANGDGRSEPALSTNLSQPSRRQITRLTIDVQDLKEQIVANIRLALLLLSGAVALLLLIACANVASLMLSRALARRKEFAVRAAMEAGRGAIIRALLVESSLLGLLGGAAGTLLAAWCTAVLMRSGGDQAGSFGELPSISACWHCTAAISLASGVLFGLIPALLVSRPDLNEVLRDEGRGATATRSRSRVRSLLVVGQVALSLVLLIGSGLLVRSFIRLETASPGFDPQGVLTMQIELPPTRYGRPERMIAFYEDAIRRVGVLPGVEAAAISSALPVNPIRFSPTLFEGQPELPLAAAASQHSSHQSRICQGFARAAYARAGI